MSFTPGIPASGQSLGSSRLQVLNNFAVLRSTIANNHVDVNASNAGAHTHADLLAQSVDPDPATGLVSHYSKEIGGVTEWFFQREASGMTPGAVIQMSVSIPVTGTSGRTFLPGGMLLLWGQCNYSSTASPAQNFQGTGFPTACFGIVISPIILPSSGIALTLGAVPLSATQFRVLANVTNGTISASLGAFYYAIGN